MSVNVNSYYNCIKESGDYLKECGNGRIVNFSSSAALSGSAYAGPAYVTSKAAALGLTKYIAGYWAKYGIRCNAICPGLTATNIVDIGDGKIKGQKEHEDKTPLKRIAYPIDMANVVLFLVSEESSYMTGQTMHVNGGKYMYLP